MKSFIIFLLCISLLEAYSFWMFSSYNSVLNRVKKEIKSDLCHLLNHPPNGRRFFTDGHEYIPGTPVSQGTAITVKCNDGYRATDTTEGGEAFCVNGQWVGDITDKVCEKTCPPLNDRTFISKCMRNFQSVNCSEAVEGTMATTECMPFHTIGYFKSKIMCRNGQWIPPIKACEPVCGKIKVRDITTMDGSSPAVHDEYPWIVAIYTIYNEIYICAGSIISQKHVLAAARCFIKNIEEEFYDKNELLVIAGKFYKKFDDEHDRETQQVRKIQKLIIHEYFKGSDLKWQYDIALLEVTEEFEFGLHIQPVCIDWEQKYDEISLTEGNQGVVAGWEKDSTRDGIRKMVLSVQEQYKCEKRFFRYNYYIADKICAGFNNKKKTFCGYKQEGDYYFESNTIYYIRGIGNLNDLGSGCKKKHYALFTRVSMYTSWLNEKIGTFLKVNHTTIIPNNSKDEQLINSTTARVQTILTDGCLLLNHPPNGQRLLSDGSEYIPNGIVIPTTTIITKCNDGFQATDVQYKGLSVCVNGTWFGDIADDICQKSCPPLNDPTRTSRCLRNFRPVNCAEAVEGTTATIECISFYTSGNFKSKIKCNNGRWTPPIGACEPVCGEKKVGSQSLIIGGSKAIRGEYPWIVALYSNRNHICGGSIIFPKYVLSAAHCFTNLYDGKPYDKNNYLVIAGKFHRDVDDVRDEKTQQVRNIKNLIIHEDYRGETQNYLADIALLEVDEEFKLTVDVQPVCIDWSHIYDEISLSDNNMGVVTGWGYTSEGSDPAAELKKAILPVHSKLKCKEHLPLDFYNKYYIFDKICAGFTDNGTSVCNGDSGGGFYFQSDRKFYIRGIVSLAPQGETGCNKNLYGLFTRVSKYSDWFKEKINAD